MSFNNKGHVFISILLFLFSMARLSALMPNAAAGNNSSHDLIALGDYLSFLNATALVDEQHFFDEKMTSDAAVPSIQRSGVTGSYCYKPGGWGLEATDLEKNATSLPVSFLSYNDVIQYCAWKNKNDAHSSSLQPLASSLSVDPELKSNQLFFEFASSMNLQGSFPTSALHDWDQLTWEEKAGAVFLGVALVGGGSAAIYNRCRNTQDAVDVEKKSDEKNGLRVNKINETLQLQQTENHLITDRVESPLNGDLRDALANDQETNEIDPVDGDVTNIKDFAKYKPSFFEGWADYLRGRTHIDSLHKNAHQISYIAEEDPDLSTLSPFQKNIIWPLTEWVYTYKDLADFKARDPEYLQEHVKEAAALKATIAGHEAAHGEKDARIATLQQENQKLREQNAAHETRIATELGSREERKNYKDLAFELHRDQQSNIAPVEKVMASIANMEHQIFYPTPSTLGGLLTALSPANPNQVDANEAATFFQQLVEVSKYYLIKNLEYLEKVARASEHKNEAELAAGRIREQHDEAWRFGMMLLNIGNTLRSENEILWKYRAEAKDAYVDLGEKKNSKSLLSEIEFIRKNTIEPFQGTVRVCVPEIKNHFDQAVKIFKEDEGSIDSRESHERTSIASTTSHSAEKLQKRKSMFARFSTVNKEEQQKEAVEKDLGIETACDELSKKIEAVFNEKIIPVIKNGKKCYAYASQFLHTAERNVLLGDSLIALYQLDQEKLIREITPLQDYLVKSLCDSRKALSDGAQHFQGALFILGGSWKEGETPAGALTMIHTKGNGGLQECYEFKHFEHHATELSNKAPMFEKARPWLVEHLSLAMKVEVLLTAAKAQADVLCKNIHNENARAAFLEAMKPLLNRATFQLVPLINNPPAAGVPVVSTSASSGDVALPADGSSSSNDGASETKSDASI